MAATTKPDQPHPENKPGSPDPKRPSGGEQTEKDLEKSLEDTFPASDPPSQSSPGQSVGWDPKSEEKQ